MGAPSGEGILVTGANGFVGAALAAALVGESVPARFAVRCGTSEAELRGKVAAAARDPGAGRAVDVVRVGEVGAGTQWAAALSGIGAVVHCAAHVHRPLETPAEIRRFHAVNAEGTGRLLAACAASGAGRFVLASTTAVYDWAQDGRARGEDDRLAPASAYGRSKLESERLVQASGLDWRIARIATVYGDGDRANFFRLAEALRRRRFVLPGDGRARKSVLPVARAAELLARLALLPGAGGSIVNLAAPAAPSLAEICAAFCAACGYARPARAPLPLLRTAGALGDALAILGVRFPLTTDVLGKLTSETVVDVGRMQAYFPDLRWDTFEDTLRKSSLYYGRIV